MPCYADVILPLAIPRPLTYAVSDEDVSRARVGCRVVVTLGKSKLLTGVIASVHTNSPEGYSAKMVDSILDDEPIVVPEQISLWSWMASYYCCTIGEVMSAALPAALKLSSETSFSLIPDFADEMYEWNNRQWAVIEAIRNKGSITLKDAADLPGIRSAQAVIKSLIEKGVLVSTEELKEKFRPRMTTFLSLDQSFRTDDALNHLFSEMETRNAKRQSDALLAFLRLASWDGEKVDDVAKPRLAKEPGVTNAAIQSLIDKGILCAAERETGRLPKEAISHGLKELSETQQSAYGDIHNHWNTKDVVLLHGVTSSGKTEVYAHLVRDVVASGKQVLFLLPEIALTAQIIERFRHYFGLATGIYHSGYSGDERTEVWKKVLENHPGDHDIVLGARSALFLPFRNLGLIIVDEEHEQSYKQVDPAPRYNARDMAVVLASMHGAKVLLGSATPSVETYWSARSDRFGLVEMTERHGGMELPAVELVDIRDELKQKSMQGHFTSKLIDEIRQTLASGRQVILFQNRRGYTPLWQCQSCGWVPECARCDVS
ncbi:MAG: primosomal protein, partial [Bacteroidota bacterium]